MIQSNEFSEFTLCFLSQWRLYRASGHCPSQGRDFIQPGGRMAPTRSCLGLIFELLTLQFQKGIPRFLAFCQSIGSRLRRRLSGLPTGGHVATRFRVLCQLVSARIRPGAFETKFIKVQSVRAFVIFAFHGSKLNPFSYHNENYFPMMTML